MSKAKLSRDYIRKLEPAEKTFQVWDSDVAGLALRVHPTGRMTWCVIYARGKRLTIGRADVMTPTDARTMAIRILADFAKGIDPTADKRHEKTPTLRAYLDGDYGKWAETHYSDGDATVKRLKVNFADLLGVRLDEITPWQIEKWGTRSTKAGVSASTLNRQLNPLKALLNRAVEFGVLKNNPLAGAAKLRRVDAAPIVRYLSEDEDRHLTSALSAREARLRRQRRSANKWRTERGYKRLPSLRTGYADHLKPMVIVSLNTGIRRGELFNLKWPDIDIKGAMLTVMGEGAKSGNTRHVPLNDDALHALRTWQAQSGSEYVFPGESGGRITSVRSSWEKVLDDAGVHDFRWHDMRHTFASRLVIAGVDLNTVRELMGHADMKMTIRYAHLAPHVKADAVSRIARGVRGRKTA